MLNQTIIYLLRNLPFGDFFPCLQIEYWDFYFWFCIMVFVLLLYFLLFFFCLFFYHLLILLTKDIIREIFSFFFIMGVTRLFILFLFISGFVLGPFLFIIDLFINAVDGGFLEKPWKKKYSSFFIFQPPCFIYFDFYKYLTDVLLKRFYMTYFSGADKKSIKLRYRYLFHYVQFMGLIHFILSFIHSIFLIF